MSSVLATLSAALALFGHIPYFIDIFHGKTKPHIFSWSIWTLLLTIGFFVQFAEGAGVGAWATLADAIACGITAVLCIKYGTRDITRSDTLSLIIGLLGVGLWQITDSALYAAISVVIADATGFFPMFRKSFMKPDEETYTTFLIVAVGYFFSLVSFQAYTVAGLIVPMYIFGINIVFPTYIIIRRIQLKKPLWH